MQRAALKRTDLGVPDCMSTWQIRGTHGQEESWVLRTGACWAGAGVRVGFTLDGVGVKAKATGQRIAG